jgi:hypothetical protein
LRGQQGYLTKPFTDVDLLGAVKGALGIAETDSALTSPGGLQPRATGRILAVLLVEDDPINQRPDGHPNSPACGHLKLPHLN